MMIVNNIKTNLFSGDQIILESPGLINYLTGKGKTSILINLGNQLKSIKLSNNFYILNGLSTRMEKCGFSFFSDESNLIITKIIQIFYPKTTLWYFRFYSNIIYLYLFQENEWNLVLSHDPRSLDFHLNSGLWKAIAFIVSLELAKKRDTVLLVDDYHQFSPNVAVPIMELIIAIAKEKQIQIFIADDSIRESVWPALQTLELDNVIVYNLKEDQVIRETFNVVKF